MDEPQASSSDFTVTTPAGESRKERKEAKELEGDNRIVGRAMSVPFLSQSAFLSAKSPSEMLETGMSANRWCGITNAENAVLTAAGESRKERKKTKEAEAGGPVAGRAMSVPLFS
jgi:hypothetical protein